MGATIPVSTPWGIGKGGPQGGGGGLPVPPNVAQATAGARLARVLEVPLPEIEPIPNAQQFNPLGQFASGGAGANVVIPGAAQVIPANQLAVVRSVTIYISDMMATTNVTWTLLYETNPVPGFQNLTIFPRVSPFVSNTFDALVRLVGPGTLSVVFSNIDGGIYNIGAAFSGWFWAQAADVQWKQTGGQ